MKKTNGWQFIPSLYLCQGIPSCLVMQTSALLFADMGIDKGSFAFWTSIVCLPWSLKPLISPVVERYSTLRRWTLTMQVLLAVCMGLLALSFGSNNFYVLSLVAMGLVALASSAHDIACDGYYMMALDERGQSFFVGIRSTFYRIALIFSTGLIPYMAGKIGREHGNATGWTVAIGTAATILLILFVYNNFFMPRIAEQHGRQDNGIKIFIRALRSFFCHEGMVPAVAFFLLYRLGEAFLTKVLQPFLIADPSTGGLGLTLEECGLTYGTFGVLSLVVGGIIGGTLAARYGLQKVIWPMAIAMNLPNLGYVVLAHYAAHATMPIVTTAVMIEQFGYGFGFAAYMLYMLRYVGNAEYKAAEYAIGTALMTLGLLIPGMPAGYLCNAVGYETFFIIACVLTLPGMFVIRTLNWRK